MRKLLVTLLVLVPVLAAVVWFGGPRFLALSVARYDGQVAVEGVAAPVEITYDGRGIPQIWAETDADLYFAFGWVHASERLFQMELIRRVAAGELAEVFGEAAFEMDVRQRRLGFARRTAGAAAGLAPSVRARYQRYVDGVNAWIAETPLLPPEFVLLRLQPRPWRVEDCLAVVLYQTWFSHALMDHDSAYQRLIERLGPEAARLLGGRMPWSPPTVPAAAGALAVPGPLGPDPYPLRATEASNAWVVAPQKSASGAALHASDPHLAVDQTPGMWYLVGLHSAEGTQALGASIPGIPFVAMGHNGTISFAFTVASVDVVDYFTETLDPKDSLRVRTPGGYAPMQVVHEPIRVKGEPEPRRVPVYTTPRGVVVARDSAAVVSLHWAGFDASVAEMTAAGFELQRAAGFDAFRRAVTRLGALDVNWTYADRSGNIGYQLGTPIPVRTYADTYARHPAADSTAAWQGYRPLDETPHALNPARGWLASCNNQIVPGGWPYELPGFYDPYRITRIETLLGSKPVLARSDMEAFQLDRVSGLGLRWKGLAADGAERLGRADVAARLRAWDAAMTTDDPAAALFTYWWHALTRPLFEDDLGAGWEEGRHLLEAVLSADSAFVDDRRTPAVETVADLSARAMQTALGQAKARPYGDVSTLTVAHPLARVKLLDTWLRLNRGPVPTGGDRGTLDANFHRYDPDADVFRTVVGPSMRFVLDWSDVDAFTINVAFGQSGNPFSRHYDDFFAPSQQGERWTVPFTRERVYARAAGLLRLVPEG